MYVTVVLCHGEEVKGSFYTFTAPSNSVYSTAVQHLESYIFSWGDERKRSDLMLSYCRDIETENQLLEAAQSLTNSYADQGQKHKKEIKTEIVSTQINAGHFRGVQIAIVHKPTSSTFFRQYDILLWDGERAWGGQLLARSPEATTDVVAILESGKRLANKEIEKTFSDNYVYDDFEVHIANVGVPCAKAIFCDKVTVYIKPPAGDEPTSVKRFEALLRKQIEFALNGFLSASSAAQIAAMSSDSKRCNEIENTIHTTLARILSIPEEVNAKRMAEAMRGFHLDEPIIVERIVVSNPTISSDFTYKESQVILIRDGHQTAFDYGIFVMKPDRLTEKQLNKIRASVDTLEIKELINYNYATTASTEIVRICNSFLDEYRVKGFVTQHTSGPVRKKASVKK